MLRILKTWECDIQKEIEKLKQQLSVLNNFPRQKAIVTRIIRDVQKRGDKAIVSYSKRFDNVSLLPEEFKAGNTEIADAYKKISPSFITSIKRAITNIWTYQEHIRIRNVTSLKSRGIILDTLYSPLDSVGIYVPGGAASYPSTVLMNAIPARVAGVNRIIMVTPPAKDGTIPPERLVAAKEAGITEIYKVGGAQSIAALAFGTETIPKVDKIVGPGNIFVTLAKKEVFGHTGIDMLAGPSEVLIIADDLANPSFVASDLLSQAEHTPGISILVTFSESLVKGVLTELKQQLCTLKRRKDTMKCLDKFGTILLAKDIDECVKITNILAPEHLQIMVHNPKGILSGIRHAGAIFMGPYTPVALGDYIAGPSHVLPTSGTARFSSGLSVNDFLKRTSIITYSKSALRGVCGDLVEISMSEGLDAHTHSVQIRLNQQKNSLPYSYPRSKHAGKGRKKVKEQQN
ncbi:MAG: histidinol dehydrogenase [Candidatus Loosdrechtia sp.]|uniref:histidinol dehydrogenase n=1 Tax=Candidatus Loosdrechtia sp. TaxID=3101272 RepID=UPI003A734184|nr:MAG: histidinol dehydrogenase [Candidatus Jettenia sp. AMX2]